MAERAADRLRLWAAGRLTRAAAALLPADRYPAPRHGWVCFHCGETFHNPVQAGAHFGAPPGAVPACRIPRRDWPLLYALRKLERERDALATRVVAMTPAPSGEQS